MKVKAHYIKAVEIDVPDEFTPIVSNPDWWKNPNESLEELADELWEYVYNRIEGALDWIDNEEGETILEA